jgi:outer membrane protein OmpA-like peptidoglycan-associated protein
LPDGGTVAIGTSQTSRDTADNMFIQGLGRNDVYLVKFKPNGQIRWRKKYGSTKKDIGVNGVATSDGGFILLGLTQEANDFKLWVAKINDTGDTSWVKAFPKIGRQRAFNITRLNGGNYIISASFENKNNQDNIRLIKIDNEGNILWEHNYYNNANEHLNDINIDMRGNIIGVGYSQSETQGDRDALVRYYNHRGEMLWERKFGKHRQDVFNAVSLLHNDTFAIAGFSESFSNKGRQIWVMKLNNDGSLVKIQQERYNTLYEALKIEFARDKDITIYKNLRIVHNGLIFKQGSSTLTPQHKKVLKSFMPRLVKVLNHYKQEIKNIQINGYTSTEWNAPNTQRYLNNAHLSNDRAMHILDYSYTLKPLKQYHTWLSQKLSTDGYSYSNLIVADKKENKIRSRRVEFEIRLK